MITPTSRSTFRSNFIRAAIHGNPGTGKTFGALTISPQCPSHITHLVQPAPPGVPFTTITDTAWLAYDSGAGRGFEDAGVWVENYYDLSNEPASTLVQKTATILRELQPRCASGEIGAVVIDSLSALDTMLEIKHSAKESKEGFKAVKADHGVIYGQAKVLPCHLIALVHTKPTFDLNEDAKRRRELRGLPTFVMKITGGAGDIYRGEMDFIFAARRERVLVDKKPVPCVMWTTNDSTDDEGKSRLLLEPKIPGDFRLIRERLGAK